MTNRILQLQDAINRRTFLSQSASGIGLAALAALLGQEGAARADGTAKATGGLPGIPHFAPKAKRVIYLFQSGAPSQMDLFDPQAAVGDLSGSGSALLHPQRPATDGHDRRTEQVSCRALDLQVRAARQIRRLAQRTSAAHGDHRRRDVRRQVDVYGGDQPRPCHHLLPDRLTVGRAAESGLLALLRPRNGESRSACICGAYFERHGPSGRSAALRPPLGQRIHSYPASGREVPQRGGSRALPLQPGRRRSRDAPRDAGRTGADQPPQTHLCRRSGDRYSHRAVRTGVPHAGVRARSDRCVERAEQHSGDVRAGCEASGHVRGELPAGAAIGGAWSALRTVVPHGMGSSWRIAERHQGPVSRHRSADDRTHHGPETARTARRYARGVGRRVRPHGLLAGRPYRDRLRPRSPPPAASRSG